MTTYERGYWRDHPEAPFAELLTTVSTMCHPEVSELYDELIELARNPEPDERMQLFKTQLREALDDPTRIPGDALHDAAKFSDGSDERFLRRLWRDLYPDEPVPGGDEEFRADLRRLANGEVEKVPSTVDYYDENWHRPKTPDELRALGREVWAKFYPDEPLS